MNIQVKCVATVFVETALSDKLMEAFQAASGGIDAHQVFATHQGRLGRPEDVGRAITHLAEAAGDWVTGVRYVLDHAVRIGCVLGG